MQARNTVVTIQFLSKQHTHKHTIVSVAVEVNSDRGEGIEIEVAGNGMITRGFYKLVLE